MIKTPAFDIAKSEKKIAKTDKNSGPGFFHSGIILNPFTKRFQKTLFRILLAGIGIILAILVLKIVLRVSQEKTFDLSSCQAQDRQFHHVMITNTSCRFKTDEWDIVYNINNLGLRNAEIGDITRGSFRILILGDSFVQGHGVETSDSFVKVLEKKLNLTHSNLSYEVVNAGVFGYSPLVEYLYLYNRGLELKPDFVVLAFSLTDFWEDRKRFAELKASYPDLSEDQIEQKISLGQAEFDFEKINMASKNGANQKVILPQVSYQLKQWLRTNFKTYAIGADFVKKRNQPVQQDILYQGDIDKDIVAIIRGNKISDDDWQKLWELPIAHIELVNNLLREKGIPLMVIAIPDAFQVSDREWPGRKALGIKQNFQDPREPYQVELSKRLTTAGIPFLDLLPDFQNSNQYPLYFTGDGHWRKAGHKLAADIIYNALKSRELDYLLHK